MSVFIVITVSYETRRLRPFDVVCAGWCLSTKRLLVSFEAAPLLSSDKSRKHCKITCVNLREHSHYRYTRTIRSRLSSVYSVLSDMCRQVCIVVEYCQRAKSSATDCYCVFSLCFPPLFSALKQYFILSAIWFWRRPSTFHYAFVSWLQLLCSFRRLRRNSRNKTRTD